MHVCACIYVCVCIHCVCTCVSLCVRTVSEYTWACVYVFKCARMSLCEGGLMHTVLKITGLKLEETKVMVDRALPFGLWVPLPVTQHHCGVLFHVVFRKLLPDC